MTKDLGLLVPAREIPVPQSVSEPAQAMLRQWSAIPFYGAPAPDDIAGWTARIAASEGALTQMLTPAANRIDATSEPIDMAGVPGFLIEAAGADSSAGVIYDIHGGGFTSGAGDLCRVFGILTAGSYGRPVYAIDYRMPPEHPYPAALDDCMAGYRYLLDHFAPESIIVRGTSAGGNLAAALALRARDEGLPSPAGLILITPELDLTESGDSFQTNAYVDVVMKGSLMNANLLYAGGHNMLDPYLSPLFGDFAKGFPPTILMAGTRDLFLSNAARMHNALRRAGQHSELIIEEAMPHGGFFGAPEDLLLLVDLKAFAARVLAGAYRSGH